jgi:HK97 family phage prohead protease/HK97 family phage major capsid protein
MNIEEQIKVILGNVDTTTTNVQEWAWWTDDDNYKKHDYTRWALGDGTRSKYRDNIKAGEEILFKRAMPFEIKSFDESNRVLTIEGMASTDDWDRDDERILAKAFLNTLSEFMENAVLLLNHDWRALPIGQVIEARVTEKGLWVKCEIVLDLPMGSAAAILIKRGILKTFSIGFRVVKWEKDEDSNRRVITELKLYEVSVVNVPANRFATFGISKEANKTALSDEPLQELVIKSFNLINNNYESISGDRHADGRKSKGVRKKMADMNITEIEKTVENFLAQRQQTYFDALDKVKSDMQRLNSSMTSRAQMEKFFSDRIEDVKKGLASEDDLKAAMSNMKSDLDKINDQILKANLGIGVKKTRFIFKDIRDEMELGVNDDEGVPLRDNALKAYKLFQAPVDYDKSEEGKLLLLARNLHDAVYLSHVYLSKRAGGYSGLRSLKSFRHLMDIVQVLDRDFAKALSTGATALGTEWVPTLMSAQMDDLYRLEPALDSYIPTWQMPSKIAEYPIKSTGATCYIASEPASNNPDEIKKSEFATGKITFTAHDFAVAIAVSRDLIEDSIVAIVPQIREELVWALKEGFEDAIINGDLTSTHMDNDTTASDDVRKICNGLRSIAKDDSKEFDTQSTSAGVGDGTTAYHEKDLMYLLQLNGIMAIRPDEGMFVTGSKGYFLTMMLTSVTDFSKWGMATTYATGALPTFLGRPIYVSGKVREDLDTTGVYTGSNATHTHILHFNRRRGVKIGERRGILVDYEFNARTQQWTFVGTMRRDFQKMTASTRYPVSNGYNID